MSAPSVVLFDLDDTLFAHREAVDAAAATTLRTLSADLDADATLAEVARWTELEEQHYHRYLTGELDYLGQRRARARDFVAPYGLDLSDDATAESWFLDYLRGYRSAWVLHEDTLPAMDAIAAALPGVRFGMITNGDLDFQLAKLDALLLTGRLEHVVASGEVGVTKPDARIFELAVDLFDVPPADAVYIGDRLRTDAIGAAAAGLTGVWLNRRGVEPDPVDHAEAERLGVHVIRGLDELPALLTRS
ncbi:HAD family hydrolase [Naasia lichenicola]|uniref:HAD family hydrolase n=1 Tax=Naasia lichenicola TaxID=2565933 RepID=A0A4S4FNM9_9MICO|nr:HAD family hydrolase [Naasia lichenicola]THG30876.1 HAD family hydrolase [Naasia lichenicola]